MQIYSLTILKPRERKNNINFLLKYIKLEPTYLTKRALCVNMIMSRRMSIQIFDVYMENAAALPDIPRSWRAAVLRTVNAKT